MQDRDVLNITRGGGALALFGLPFLGMGLFFVYLFLAPPEGATITGEPWIGALVGGVFALVGAGLVFGRSGIRLDRSRGYVTTWWGLLVPFSSTEYRLDQFTQVSVTREVRRGKNSTYEVFPVRLEGEGVHVTCSESRTYDEARRQGEEIAKFANLGVHDSSTGEDVIREAGTLDESVQDRARRLHIVTPLPSQPPRAACKFNFGGPHSTSVIDIPPEGIGAMHSAGLIGALVFSGFVGYQFFGPQWGPDMQGGDWIFLTFFGVFFFALPVGAALVNMLSAATSRQRITISPSGVQVSLQRMYGTKTIEFPAAEVEEVETTGLKTDDPDALAKQLLRQSGQELTPSQQARIQRIASPVIAAGKTFGQFSKDDGEVIIRSDRASCRIGTALSRAEKEWLRNVIVHVLTEDVTGAAAKPALREGPVHKAHSAEPDASPFPGPQPAAATPEYGLQTGTARRMAGSGPGRFAISLAGLAVLVFVLYQNGALRGFFPTRIDEPATPAEAPRAVNTRTVQADVAPPAPKAEDRGETDRLLQQSLATAEQAYGPDHPAVAVVLYQMGVKYQANKRPKEQEQAWLRALAVLERTPKKFLGEPNGGIDKEMVARDLGDFYWDQYRYADSYKHYDLAYKYADDVQMDDAERNRRLASNSAGIMATACYLGKWEIADYAMEELKERIKTVSPDEQKRLQYWVRTGEPRLKKRKC